jgi:hypothetical protein
MHMWDYDKEPIKHGDAAERWHLIRLALYGLHGEKIQKNLLRKHLPHIQKQIPKEYYAFLQFCLDA